ncbi:YbhB/YbcL family Raf kinase inhibitor-like protein [Flavobacterium algicola]|uniref:YbhB/YbcL family Raf kinase inhibitor-like protein n=1 Tax=Flavobacterium algicola TaxID=556529 RepID=UPI001EFC4BED|nr:YbhB/YbcL family Raf kinase inhibitor-like protein [Flavobacterium algicola]MCG9793458.1 YbhB/YbcL family Raf kinase inhibitor-like protein [Flavobacterium algicola]
MKTIKYLLPVLLLTVLSCKDSRSNLTNVNHDHFKTVNPSFKLTSKAIENGELLDAFKCEEKVEGVENSIPLAWENVPAGTKSLAVVMYHYPKKDDKTEINSYLLLWNIDPTITEIPYKMANNGSWYMGANKDGNAISYTSPCSQGKGKHTYTIALYALAEVPVALPKSSSVEVDYNKFMNAIGATKIIDRTTLTFTDTKI